MATTTKKTPETIVFKKAIGIAIMYSIGAKQSLNLLILTAFPIKDFSPFFN
jgi:hypothetical protein